VYTCVFHSLTKNNYGALHEWQLANKTEEEHCPVPNRIRTALGLNMGVRVEQKETKGLINGANLKCSYI
jgi:hypothetical protein